MSHPAAARRHRRPARRVWAAAFGLGCSILAGLPAAAETASGATDGPRFDLRVAAGPGDQGAASAFGLGLRSALAFDNAFGEAPAPPAPAGRTLRLPTGAGDWQAQDDPPEAPAPTLHEEETGERHASDEVPEKPYGWKQLRFDLRYIARRPAHLTDSDQRALAAVAGTTALLYVFREDIQDAWRRNSSESRTDFLNSARVMGGAGFAPAVALAAWGASFITDNDREKETAQLLMESWALAAVGSGVGSFVLAAERPEDGNDVHVFDLEGHGVSYDVSVAASVIPPLRRQYLRVRPGDGTGTRILKHGISALLYSGMVFTALQRIDADKHWAPDVFLGMVNGLGVGTLLGQARDEADRRRSRVGLSAQPGGLAVTWTLSLDPQ